MLRNLTSTAATKASSRRGKKTSKLEAPATTITTRGLLLAAAEEPDQNEKRESSTDISKVGEATVQVKEKKTKNRKGAKKPGLLGKVATWGPQGNKKSTGSGKAGKRAPTLKWDKFITTNCEDAYRAVLPPKDYPASSRWCLKLVLYTEHTPEKPAKSVAPKTEVYQRTGHSVKYEQFLQIAESAFPVGQQALDNGWRRMEVYLTVGPEQKAREGTLVGSSSVIEGSAATF